MPYLVLVFGVDGDWGRAAQVQGRSAVVPAEEREGGKKEREGKKGTVKNDEERKERPVKRRTSARLDGSVRRFLPHEMVRDGMGIFWESEWSYHVSSCSIHPSKQAGCHKFMMESYGMGSIQGTKHCLRV